MLYNLQARRNPLFLLFCSPTVSAFHSLISDSDCMPVCLYFVSFGCVPVCVCVCGWWWWGFYAINSAFIDASSGYPFLISNCWWKQPDFCLKSECCFEVELQNLHYFLLNAFARFSDCKIKPARLLSAQVHCIYEDAYLWASVGGVLECEWINSTSRVKKSKSDNNTLDCVGR